MTNRLPWLALLAGLIAAAGCRETRTPTPQQEIRAMDNVLSPAGDRHPGEILNVDKINGRTWTDRASAVPQTIAWVKEGERYKAVVRIEATGTPERMCITKYGVDGAMLETTISSPPPPARPRPEPIPVPTPMPDDTPGR